MIDNRQVSTNLDLMRANEARLLAWLEPSPAPSGDKEVERDSRGLWLGLEAMPITTKKNHTKSDVHA